MLYELQIPDPKNTVLKHWDSVPFLKGKKAIEFKPGLNIVFGPNGSGKSTVITTIAKLMHCHQGGFQRVTEHSVRDLYDIRLGSDDKEDFDSKQRVTHDGDEVRYVGAEQDVGHGLMEIDGDFGGDQISMMFAKRDSSSGQGSLYKFNRVLLAKGREGKVAAAWQWGQDSESLNDYWLPRTNWCWRMLQGKKRPGPKQLVLLADEPDRSMDLERQQYVWEFLRSVCSTGKVQIIAATHSVFALGLPEAHYIETAPDAQKTLAAVLGKAGFKRDEVPAALSFDEFRRGEVARAAAAAPPSPKKAGPRRSRDRRPARGA